MPRQLHHWVATAVVVCAVVAGCGGGHSGTPAAQPTVRSKHTLPALNADGPIDLTQAVFVFSDGAASVVHRHPSPNLATVLQGKITVRTLAGEKEASTWDSLSEPLNQAVQAFNSGSDPALVAVAFALPQGGKPTVPVAGQPAPAVANKAIDTFTAHIPNMSGGYSLVQQVLDFRPGAATPKHRHGGTGVVTVIQGTVTFTADGASHVFQAGQSFTEMPGQTLQTSNRGTTELVLVATFAVPDGAQLTTNV